MQEIDPIPSNTDPTPTPANPSPTSGSGPSPLPSSNLPQLEAPSAPYPPTQYASSGQISVPTNTLAIVSLIASILSWVGLFGIGGIVALITGVMARNEIKRSNGMQSGDGLALTGIVLGAVNIAMTCILALCGMMFFALAIGNSGR